MFDHIDASAVARTAHVLTHVAEQLEDHPAAAPRSSRVSTA
jgi:hypothetical protein